MNSEKIISVAILTGPLKGREFPVKAGFPPLLIGRSDEAAIQITYDDYCSRRHATIYRKDNLCFIEDLNSTNGTLLNDLLFRGKKELKDKDVLGLGSTKLIISIKDSLSGPAKEETNVLDLATPIKSGDSIYGRYEVSRILKGGIGLACACYDNISRVPCVLKTFQRKYLASPQSQAFFEKEALTWIGLGKHPHIVSAYLVIRIEDYPFLVFDYIAPDENGRNTLSHYLNNLTTPEILKYSIEFCYGMEYVYAKDFKAHGNIKPGNIMITPDRNVKITDFGAAQLLQKIEFKECLPENEKSDLSIFQGKAGVVSGTLPYMAPEQFDGQMDQVSDIYSFGVVLYQMASSGALPFTGRNPLEYEKAHKEGASPRLDSPLFAIIAKCLEKDPAKRYTSFAAIRLDLDVLFLKETGKKIIPLEGVKSEAAEILNKGLALYSFGKRESGIACYDKAISINPEYPDAYYNRGNAYYDRGNLEQAISDYSKAIEINPVYINAYYKRGVFYQGKGNLIQAISDYNKVISMNSAHSDAYYNRGNAYYTKGDLEQAISDYSRVIEIDPVHLKAYYNRGIAYYDKDDPDLAIADFSKAIGIDPEYAEAYNNRGNAYYDKGESGLATADFSKAIEINPKYAEAYNNRGIAYYKKGNLEQAISDYSQAIGNNPKYAEAYNNRGIAYYKKGNLEQAISDYSQAVGNNPKYAEAYNNRGIACHKKGNFEQALSDYSKAVEINPKDSEAYNNRGIVHHIRGKLDLAIADFNKAIEINPAYSRAYYNRGSAYYDKDDLTLAIANYSKAIEYNTKDVEAYNSRGVAYHVRGKLELAIADFNKAIEINPVYLKAYYSRGSVYYDKDEPDLAIADFSKAIEINPEYAKAYCNRVVAYLLKKDYDKSWKDIHKAEELGYKVPVNLINDLKRASGRGM